MEAHHKSLMVTYIYTHTHINNILLHGQAEVLLIGFAFGCSV